MVTFMPTLTLNEEDKRQISEMTGKMTVWMIEGRHTAYMAEQLKMGPHHVESNIDEMLYVLRKYVGWKRYLRALFRK